MNRRPTMISALWDGLSEIQQEAEWRKCANDYAYFAETYFAIKVPGKGQQPLILREAQKETSRIWLQDRFSITLKARQIGFSTLAASVALWHVLFHDDREIVFLSKTGADARKLLSIVTYAWKALPMDMRERAGHATRVTIDTFEMDNGSKIQSLNSNNPARGYSAYLIFVDEAAFFEKFDQAWAAIEPAADIGGRIHVLSTANGVGNGFHEMWVKARTGISGYTPIFYPWSASGRDQHWFDQKCRSMPEWQRAQEYPSTEQEAFIKSGRPVFDVDKFQLDLCTPEWVGYLDGGPARPQFEAEVDGPLQVWAEPIPGHKYVMGADVAEGLDYGDYSVVFVIDTADGNVVAKWRGHIDPDSFGDETIYDIARWYNRALVGIEVNNHGFTTVNALKKRSYANQYTRTSYDERNNISGRKLGWRTDVKSKRLAIDELREALRDEEIRLHDDECVGELQTFVRDDKGRMHGSPFDDQVMALAIANQMRKHWHTRTKDEVEPEDFWSGAALEYRIRVSELQVGDWTIGQNRGSSFARTL